MFSKTRKIRADVSGDNFVKASLFEQSFAVLGDLPGTSRPGEVRPSHQSIAGIEIKLFFVTAGRISAVAVVAVAHRQHCHILEGWITTVILVQIRSPEVHDHIAQVMRGVARTTRIYIK